MNLLDIVIYIIGASVLSLFVSVVFVVFLRLAVTNLAILIIRRKIRYPLKNGEYTTRHRNNNTNYHKNLVNSIQYLYYPYYIIRKFFRQYAIFNSKCNTNNGKRTNEDTNNVVDNPLPHSSNLSQASTTSKQNRKAGN